MENVQRVTVADFMSGHDERLHQPGFTQGARGKKVYYRIARTSGGKFKIVTKVKGDISLAGTDDIYLQP